MTAKTYACKNATINSKKTIINKITIRKEKIKKSRSSFASKIYLIFKIMSNEICSKECPATIFENKRIDKLKIRMKWEKNSRINKKGIEIFGTPCGINNLKNKLPFLSTFKKVIPIIKQKDKVKLEYICVVQQGVFGSKPITLNI